MSETYTKLFTSITASTVWQEPAGTRLTWITMLAMADKNGDVFASIPGLARIANVTLEEVEAALRCFLSPDPYSRTKEHDGRRVEEIDGGWRLLNHAKFREIRSAAERAEYKREWDRRNRPSGHARAQSDSPTAVRTSPTVPTNAAAPAPAPDTDQCSLRSHARAQEVSRGTSAGLACKLMREAGCLTTNPSHPHLLAALEEGVTPEALRDTAAEAVAAGKSNPFPWAIATARSRRAEGVPATNGGSNGTARKLSAVEQVRAANERRRREPADALEGTATRVD